MLLLSLWLLPSILGAVIVDLKVVTVLLVVVIVLSLLSVLGCKSGLNGNLADA